MHIAAGHEIQFVAGKANDFRFDRRIVRADHQAAGAYGGDATHRFQGEAHHAGQPSLYHQGGCFGQTGAPVR